MEQAVPSTSHLSEDTDPDLCEPSSSSESPHASSSQEPETAPKSKPQSRVGNFQPSVMYLKKLGIKVRDFAFESTLPPVPTYYLQPRQVQPSVNRPLQRRSTEPDDGSQQQSQGTQTLERRPTEPVVTPEQTFHMKAFDNLEDYDELTVNSQQSGVHQDSLSNFQVPTPTLETQNSTILLTTPSSIAEGRHAWNTGSHSIRTSSTLHPLGSSQAAGSEPAPHVPELRNSNGSSISGIFTISFPSSPLTPLPSSPSSSPPNGVRVTPLSSQLSITLRSNSTYELRSPGTPRVLATSTRYFLRKRPSPSSSLTSPSKPSKRIRKFAPPESPLRAARDSSTSSSSKASSSRTKTTRTKAKKTKSKDKSGSSNSRSGRNASASKDKGKGKRKAC